MKNILGRTIRFIGNRQFLLLLTLTSAGYVLLEKIGVFRLEPASYREIFHSFPSRILGILFAMNAVLGLVLLFRDRESGNTTNRRGTALFLVSILIMAIGLWVSIFTRFEGKVREAEMGTLEGFISEYDRRTIYMPSIMMKKRELPRVGITFVKIDPVTSPDMKKLKRVTADILYASSTAKKIEQAKLRSDWPLITGWTMIKITDFGYAPKYELKSISGLEYESERVYLRLFPPGSEDSFTAVYLGYIFYLKCYPDYVEQGGKRATLSAYAKNPVFQLRIVRNKDTVYNGLLRPTEKLRFDNTVLTLPEVKPWVEITLIKDFGLPIIGAGLLLLIAGVILMTLRRR